MTYLSRYESHAPNSPEQDAEVDRIAQEIRTLGAPTNETMREMLRVALDDCDFCFEEDADAIRERDLPGWLLSHGVDPGAEERRG
jgi:hypothetical protein